MNAYEYVDENEEFRDAFWDAQESGMYDNDRLLEMLVGWIGSRELRDMCRANELYVPGFEKDANWMDFEEE